MGIGDIIFFNLPPIILSTGAVGGTQMRVLTGFASANSITVNSNITIDDPGVSFRWWKFTTGTGADDGYIAFPPHGNLTFNATVDTLNATSLDYVVECRMCVADQCMTPVAMAGPTNITTATTNAIRVNIVDEQTNQCRFGMKLNTDTGVQSITIRSMAELRP
jgi:DNA/RNA-binding domain of Phe-tRNA-synthetase-like protein